MRLPSLRSPRLVFAGQLTEYDDFMIIAYNKSQHPNTPGLQSAKRGNVDDAKGWVSQIDVRAVPSALSCQPQSGIRTTGLVGVFPRMDLVIEEFSAIAEHADGARWPHRLEAIANQCLGKVLAHRMLMEGEFLFSRFAHPKHLSHEDMKTGFQRHSLKC